MYIVTFTKIVIIGLCCMATSELRADLNFTQSTVQVTPMLKEENVKCRFEFVNGGQSRTLITGLRASCGCATATSSRAAFNPGEAGFIEVVMKVAGRLNGDEQQVVVQTHEDSGDRAIVLTARVTEPKLVDIRPPAVCWVMGEPLAVRLSDIWVEPNAVHLRLVAARSESPDDVAELQTLEDGRHYRLKVLTTGTTRERNSAIYVITNVYANDGLKEIRVLLKVTPRSLDTKIAK